MAISAPHGGLVEGGRSLNWLDFSKIPPHIFNVLILSNHPLQSVITTAGRLDFSAHFTALQLYTVLRLSESLLQLSRAFEVSFQSGFCLVFNKILEKWIQAGKIMRNFFMIY